MRVLRLPEVSVLPDPSTIARPWLQGYPPGVPPTYRYPDVPLPRFLDDAARDFPTHTATWFAGAKLTWARLADQVDRFATALRELGVGRGTPVGVVLPNLPANPIATFAILRLGGVVVQHDPRLGDDELRHQLRDSACEVVVALATLVPRLGSLRSDLPALRHVVSTGVEQWLPTRRRLLFPVLGRRRGAYRRVTPADDVLDWEELLVDAAPIVEQTPVAATDPALVQYTGGTTGVRKGVVLSHGNLVTNSFQSRLWVPDIQAGRERVLCVMPFAHAYGFTLGMMTAVLSAATMVLVPRFDADELLDVIDRTKPTLFPGVPIIYRALVEHPKVGRHDLTSIRACVSGAAPLPPELAREFEALAGGARLREGYGLSEAGPLTHANPVYGRFTSGAIGLPVTDTVAAVVDPTDPERLLGPDQPGELIVAGPQVMQGYLGDRVATAQVLQDGWLLTGDIVEQSAEGVFHLVDRKRDVIHARGHNLYPKDIERVLLAHDAVARAAVVGVPDGHGDEIVTAYVVPVAGRDVDAEELDGHCRRSLAAFSVPRAFDVRDELPESILGKVLRRELLDEAMAKRAEAAAQRIAAEQDGRADLEEGA